MSERNSHAPEYWVKSPAAASAFGPLGPGRLALLINAGIVRDDSLIAGDGSDFQPVGAVKLKELAAPEPQAASGLKVVRRDPLKPGPSADQAGENRFAGGYEVVDVVRFNRMMEKSPELNLPPRWKDPRVRDLIRFGIHGAFVTLIYACAMIALRGQASMDYAGFATFFYVMGMGLVWLVVFILFPTRPGF